MRSGTKRANALNNNRAFTMWNARTASVVLLAVALFVGVSAGRIRKFATSASGGKVNRSNNL